MKPIGERVRLAFDQGLRCVQYRVPKQEEFRPSAFELALGLRYGLVGVAAAHHLSLSADIDEEHRLHADLSSWVDLVETHVRQMVEPLLAREPRDAFSIVVAEHAQKPLSAYLALQNHLYPFEYYLEIVLSLFLKAHHDSIVRETPLLRRRSARSHFHDTARTSLTYAIRFFERREAQLEEVPEIALLGE